MLGREILCGMVFPGEKTRRVCEEMLAEIEEYGYTCVYAASNRERALRSYVARVLRPILRERNIHNCRNVKRVWKCYELKKSAYAAIADMFERMLTPRRLPACLEKEELLERRKGEG